jgi:hypothetical protein
MAFCGGARCCCRPPNRTVQTCSQNTRDMFSLLILVLLEDSVRTARKTDLVNFVTSSKAASASQLSTEVFASLCNVANRLARTSVLGAHAALWQLKNDGSATG